jgi:hypothetical protein
MATMTGRRVVAGLVRAVSVAVVGLSAALNAAPSFEQCHQRIGRRQ